MSKPVDRIEFWKERIENAQKEHYSVYVTGDSDWKHLNAEHKKILEEKVKGKVLDAGCGYGRTSELIDDYLGVDFSPDFIKKAQGKYPDKKFEVGNLKELRFEDNEFDWAICVSIKAMIVDNLGEEEWDKMEKELKRVAKQVLILEYTDPEVHEII